MPKRSAEEHMESRDESPVRQAPDAEIQVQNTWHVVAQLLAQAVKEAEETSPNWGVVTQLLTWALEKIDETLKGELHVESPPQMTADLPDRSERIFIEESPVPQAPAAENNCDHVMHVRTILADALEGAQRMAGTSGASAANGNVAEAA